MSFAKLFVICGNAHVAGELLTEVADKPLTPKDLLLTPVIVAVAILLVNFNIAQLNL